MTKKLLLIVNPNAGRMKAGTVLLDLISEFSRGGYDVTVFPTAKKSDAEERVKNHGGNYDLIVSCGGDGTLSETVNGLAWISETRGKRVPFGFVPAGTANDFANTVGMPNGMKEAARAIIGGRNRSLDFGRFNDRYFIYVAAFGLFTSVSYTVPQDMKKTLGQFAYLLEGLKQAIDVPSRRLTVEYNGKVIRDDFVLGAVTNSTSVAGMFKLNKARVKLNDGKFEVTLVRDPKNPVRLSKLIMDLSAQRFDPRYVLFEKTEEVKVSSGGEPVAWCLDGEDGGSYGEAAIKNLHKKGVIRI
ncbi:MAG: YegS/Rv2252/BmrU family lipid kinase [Oscillospiraceae bacterium]|jgi:YegS/Rv2252/BmrU family lipid kinase|nr:YegS/Rv2252/BmrU family lipid kinase [Oscillospiraceae bacterium]